MPWLKPPTRSSALSESAAISSTSSMRSSLTGPVMLPRRRKLRRALMSG